MLYLMRRLERWLRQHIFKVGWLLTKDLQKTTILFYIIFLPGVVLHELVLWLTAGLLDVRAERAIEWPEAQAAAELRLTFVKLSRSATPLQIAVISAMPVIAGIALVGFIANNVLNVGSFFEIIAQGGLRRLGEAVTFLLETPDVFLWVYLLFTISNTMFPDSKALRGWRPVLIGLAIAIRATFIIGIGDVLIDYALAGPLQQILNILSATFAVIIAINLLATIVLGTVEAVIERITGDSATFQGDKLIAMRRAEIVELRRQQREKQIKQMEKKARLTGGPPSIYSLPLPIPGPPGRERSVVSSASEPQPMKAGGSLEGRAGPAMITGTAIARVESSPEPADTDAAGATPDQDDDERAERT